RIARIGSDVAAFTTAHGVPIRAIDAAAGSAGDGDRAVILLRSVHPIGKTIVRYHVVELRRRLVGLRCPAYTAVVAYIGDAGIRFDHPAAVVGIDPQPVIVSVGNADCRKASAAIIGAIHSGIEDVDAIGGTGIGKDVGVVEGALAILAIAVHQR